MDQEKIRAVQKEVCETAKAMDVAGLTAGTWGNVSGRVDDKYMVITPSGMEYTKLTPEQMVLVNMETFEYEGDLKPSVETPIHARLLLERPEMNGVIHTHSTAAVTIACARKGIPAISEDQVQILGGDVRCSDYCLPGSKELADTIIKVIEGRTGALMASHGAITVGPTLKMALTAAILLEKTARIYLDVQAIGGAVELSPEDCAFFHDFFMTKYGQK